MRIDLIVHVYYVGLIEIEHFAFGECIFLLLFY